MTIFQKAATLAVRFYMLIMFMYGVIGLVEMGYLVVTGHPDPNTREHVVVGIVWIVTSSVGMAASVVIGKWLGRGLG